MFCPNCGKDCADAKFCPSCGHSLQDNSTAQSTEERRKQLQASGEVHCPECLSTSVTIQENNHIQNEHLLYRNPIAKIIAIILQEVRRKRARMYGQMCVCLKCGHQWYPKMYALHERHLACVSHLWEVGNDGITYPVNRNQNIDLTVGANGIAVFCGENRICFVPYDEIVTVDHRPANKVFYGRLTIRSKSSKRKPIPKTYEQARKDKQTVLYEDYWTTTMCEVYKALHRIIVENKGAGLVE